MILQLLPIICIAIAMILMTTTPEVSLRRLALSVVLFASGSVGATVLILAKNGLNILYIVPAIMFVFTTGFLFLYWKNLKFAEEEQRLVPPDMDDPVIQDLRSYHIRQAAYYKDEAKKSLYGAGLTFLVAAMSWGLVFTLN